MAIKDFSVKQRRTEAQMALCWVIVIAVGGCTTSSDASDGFHASGGSPQTATTGGTAAASTESPEVAGAAGALVGGAPSSDTAGGEGSVEPTSCHTTGDGTTTLVFVNSCGGPLTVRGSDGVAGELQPGELLCVAIGTALEPLSSLRYWGFLGEDPGGEHHTLAEFTFNTDFYDFDWYNLSHVDAHNLPMQIVPIDAADCRPLTCATSLLAGCPEEGLYRDSSGNVSACVSPDRDNASSPVAQYFETSCADAYSWSGDDAESMAACAGEDYRVVFCP